MATEPETGRSDPPNVASAASSENTLSSNSAVDLKPIEKTETPVDIFDADGALSRAYLLQRGYCCENGCRNCPYGFKKPER